MDTLINIDKIKVTVFDGYNTYAQRIKVEFGEDIEFKNGDTLVIDGYLAVGNFLKFSVTKLERKLDGQSKTKET